MVSGNGTDSTPGRGERELVRQIARRLGATPFGVSTGVDFGDDMAPLDPATPDLLWTTDMLMDGVDFESDRHDWRAIGRKALAVNLSDCAAMGARPIAALIAVALSNDLSVPDALDLLDGAQSLGREFDCPIVGGDTNSWDQPTAISVCVAGRCAAGKAIRRDGARPGDRVWVSGRVGGSILGRHLSFTPRVELGATLAETLRPRAMIDVSDGVAIDLGRIAEASGVGAVLAAGELDAAIHPDAARLAREDGRSARAHALHDGEDFELLVVLPADAASEEAEGAGLLPLGTIIRESGLWLDEPDGTRKPLSQKGWEHFQ